MLLEPAQEELLARLVEIHLAVPKEDRGAFLSMRLNAGEDYFVHQSNKGSTAGSIEDAEILAARGLLQQKPNRQGNSLFAVTPEGIAHYRKLKAAAPAGATIETAVKEYLDSEPFQSAHPKATRLLKSAVSFLWSERSDVNSTKIGHECREAMQEFAASLAAKHHVDVNEFEMADTVGRLAKVLQATADKRSERHHKALVALIDYWKAVMGMAQRQEHGLALKNASLTWDDGRRVVFQTCFVMFEVDAGFQ